MVLGACLRRGLGIEDSVDFRLRVIYDQGHRDPGWLQELL